MKALLTFIFSVALLHCSAQKQLLTYKDLQYIIQNNTATVTAFLQQKDYHIQTAANGEIRFFGLYADNDYTDIDINQKGKRTNIVLSTTHIPQIAGIQQELQNFTFKNSKGGKLYRIKDSVISNLFLKEDEARPNTNKICTIEVEN